MNRKISSTSVRPSRGIDPKLIAITKPQDTGNLESSNSTDIALSKFVGPDGSRLTKSFKLDASGDLSKNSSPIFSKGIAQTTFLTKLSDIEKLINGLSTNECLSTGIFDSSNSKIVTSAQFVASTNTSGLRTRSKTHMKQPPLGLALFDYDSNPHMPEHIECDSPSTIMAKIVAAIPELRGVGFSATDSCSSGIYGAQTGELLSRGGAHIYIAIGDIDLDDFRQFLEVRLWQAGLGYISFAANGSMLTKTIIDLSVLSPERLIYESRPILCENLKQKDRVWTHESGDAFEGPTELNQIEFNRFNALVSFARNDDVNVAIAEKLSLEHYDNRIRKTAELKGITPTEARRTLSRPAINNSQMVYDNLNFDDVVEIGNETISVSELVDRGDEFNRRPMPDPIEGPPYGTSTAMYFHNDGFRPCIHSFAHGLRTLYIIRKNACEVARG